MSHVTLRKEKHPKQYNIDSDEYAERLLSSEILPSALPPRHHLSIVGEALCRNGELVASAVVPEGDGGSSFLVQLQVGIPVECAAIVLRDVWQGTLIVLRLVEIFTDIIARDSEVSVTIGHARPSIGKDMQVDGDYGLVGLPVSPVSLLTRGVVSEDIYAVEMAELPKVKDTP